MGVNILASTRDRLRDGAVTDRDPLLHPRYGWHEFSKGLSWRKLRLFYGSDSRRPRVWWFLVLLGPFASLYGATVFFIGGRSLITFGLAAISVLVTYWCVRPFVRSGIQCWRATRVVNDPPLQVASTDAATISHLSSPVKVIDNHLAVSALIVSIDRSINPSRIYTRGRPGDRRSLGSHVWIVATDERVLVHHLGPLLAVTQQKKIPIEHVLATHEVHELAHWALEGENEAIDPDHAPRWNRRLSTEIRYVSGDGSALWDDRRHNRPPRPKADFEGVDEATTVSLR